MDIQELIAKRRSYRGKYADTPVPREDLHRIMEAGLDAPSGCNTQTTSLIAVDDPQVLSRLREEMQLAVGATAPAMIVVMTSENPGWDGRLYNVQDYAAAIENMLLTITAMGYQSCWVEGKITGADQICKKMAKVLNVPEGYRIVCYLPVGIAEDPLQTPEKKSFSERAWFNGFGKDE